VGGVGAAPATWVLADLEQLSFEVHEVPKALEHTWTGEVEA